MQEPDGSLAAHARIFRSRSVPLVWCLILSVAGIGCAAHNAMRGDTLGARSQAACTPQEIVTRADSDQHSYIIRPGDNLQISFYLSPEFNREVTVRPDGKIALDFAGEQQAAGLTPAELGAELDRAYLRELRNPGVTVHLKDSPSRRVFVEGQVQHPGAFALEPNMTALQAVAEAGGVTDEAKSSSAVIIRRDACGAPEGIGVDLAAADGGSHLDDAALMPADILVVPRSRIANLDLFVKQYVQNLLPIQPYAALPTF